MEVEEENQSGKMEGHATDIESEEECILSIEERLITGRTYLFNYVIEWFENDEFVVNVKDWMKVGVVCEMEWKNETYLLSLLYEDEWFYLKLCETKERQNKNQPKEENKRKKLQLHKQRQEQKEKERMEEENMMKTLVCFPQMDTTWGYTQPFKKEYQNSEKISQLYGRCCSFLQMKKLMSQGEIELIVVSKILEKKIIKM